MEKNWIDQQIKDILMDKKKGEKRYDTTIMIKLMIFIIGVLFFNLTTNAKCEENENIICYEIVDEGIHFTCKRCGTSQWQSKRNADWMGNFYCRKCGEKAI